MYLVENKKLPDDTTLEDMTLDELKDLAKEKNLKGYSKLSKEELIKLLKEEPSESDLKNSAEKEQ